MRFCHDWDRDLTRDCGAVTCIGNQTPAWPFEYIVVNILLQVAMVPLWGSVLLVEWFCDVHKDASTIRLRFVRISACRIYLRSQESLVYVWQKYLLVIGAPTLSFCDDHQQNSKEILYIIFCMKYNEIMSVSYNLLKEALGRFWQWSWIIQKQNINIE